MTMPAYDAITPPQWVLFLWVALIAFSIMWWLFWRTGRPAGAKIERDEAGPIEIVERVWYAVLHWWPSIMTRGETVTARHDPDTTVLANAPKDGLQPIAMLRKAANDGLALGGLGDLAANGLEDITPAEVRAIIRQQARAEAIVAILRAVEAGKVKSAGDQAGLIEAVAGGARTSRPGTPYILLKAAVDELRGKARPEYIGDMIERVHREVAKEQA
jgi:hypothetical protein